MLMCGLGVELSLERDRTQARASHSGLKDDIVMVYQPTVAYRWRDVCHHTSTWVIASIDGAFGRRCDVSLSDKGQAIMQPRDCPLDRLAHI